MLWFSTFTMYCVSLYTFFSTKFTPNENLWQFQNLGDCRKWHYGTIRCVSAIAHDACYVLYWWYLQLCWLLFPSLLWSRDFPIWWRCRVTIAATTPIQGYTLSGWFQFVTQTQYSQQRQQKINFYLYEHTHVNKLTQAGPRQKVHHKCPTEYYIT